MPYETKYEPGQHNVMCAHCCGIFKFRMMKRQWNKLLTCGRCWDPDPGPILQMPAPPKDEMRPTKEIQKEEDD